MPRAGYYARLQEQINRADSQPLKGGKTREQLKLEINEITATLCGSLDNSERIGLVADRRELRRELAALGE